MEEIGRKENWEKIQNVRRKKGKIPEGTQIEKEEIPRPIRRKRSVGWDTGKAPQVGGPRGGGDNKEIKGEKRSPLMKVRREMRGGRRGDFGGRRGHKVEQF